MAENYIIGQANPTPFASLGQGYALGAGIRDDQAAQQAKIQQQQAAQQQQQLLSNLANNPNATANDYAHVMTAIPAIAENLQKAWATKNAAQQQSSASDSLQWGSAIASGNEQIAADLMNARADAIEKSAGGPTQDSQALRVHAQVAVAHPQFALGQIQAFLAANPNGKQSAETLSALADVAKKNGTLSSDVRKASADASTAESGAAVAAATVPANIAKVDFDNQKTANDIAIANLNTQIAQANSETERGKLVLERDKLVQQQSQQKQEQGNSAQDALDTVNTSLSTVDRLLAHPGLAEGSGSGGNLRAWFASSDASDFRSQLQTLKAQQFLVATQKAKGLGPLSDSDAKRLEANTASVDPEHQSPDAVRTQLMIIKRSLERAQQRATVSPNLPTSKGGGGFVANNPVYGKITENDINSLLQSTPGSTREQVLQFLEGAEAARNGAAGVPTR